MHTRAYYNENDPKAAAWLRELIKEKVITDGEVDERSIEDVLPADLAGFRRCHFFAGIGVWDYALWLAEWDSDRTVWTGSCPCQPFSTAGKGTGFADERHLFPAWFHLIEVCRPDVLFGEQVASKDGLTWLDLVLSDLEGISYTTGAIDLPAAGVGAPHIRQRIFFVGYADGRRREQRYAQKRSFQVANAGRSSGSDDLVNTIEPGLERYAGNERNRNEPGRLKKETIGSIAAPGFTNGFWRDAEWIYCRDEKYRPVKPGIFPLANGTPGRVALLRGAGNAIVAEAAAEFIKAAKISLDEK